MVQTVNPLDIEYYIIYVKAQELYKYKYFNIYELSHSCLLRPCSHSLFFRPSFANCNRCFYECYIGLTASLCRP